MFFVFIGVFLHSFHRVIIMGGAIDSTGRSVRYDQPPKDHHTLVGFGSHLGQTERSRRQMAGTHRTLRRTGRPSCCGSRGCGAACRHRRTGHWRTDRHL